MGRYLLLDVYWRGRTPRLIFYDTEEGKVVGARDHSHRPYFLIPDPMGEEYYDPINDTTVTMRKIEVQNPGEVPRERTRYDEVYEADIPYFMRYIADKKLVPMITYDVVEGKLIPSVNVRDWEKLLSLRVPDLPVISLDLELPIPPDSFPNPRSATEPLLVAALSSNIPMSGKCHNLAIVVTDKKREFEIPDTCIEIFSAEEYGSRESAEARAIETIYSIVSSYPILITFNGDGFDLLYLMNRAKRLGAKFQASEISSHGGRNKTAIRLPDTLHIDLSRFYSQPFIQNYAFGGAYDTVSLDELSRTFLGRGKTEPGEFTEENIEVLTGYCVNDAVLTRDLFLFENATPLNLIAILSRILRMPPFHLIRDGISWSIFASLTWEHAQRKWLIPNRADLSEKKAETKAVIKGKKYRGAIVLEPKKGVHWNVTVLDFTSLYPTIVSVRNVSYETVNCPHEDCRDNRVPETNHWVCKRRKGLMSEYIGALRDLRAKVFKPLAKKGDKWADIIQRSLKVVLNASYGVMGSPSFRLYTPAAAEAVTAYARHALLSVKEFAESLGASIIYGDTDSIFVKNVTDEEIEKIIEYSKSLGLELDLEHKYRLLLLSKKKNYIGFEGDKVVIKGMVGKKSNTPPAFRRLFSDIVEVFKSVSSDADLDRAKERVKELVYQFMLDFDSGNIPPEDLAVTITLTKDLSEYTKNTPEHVKAAKLLMEHGRIIRNGDRVTYLKTTKGPIPLSLYKGEKLDRKRYLDILATTIGQILEALGIDFNELVGTRAVTLDHFF